MRDLSQREKILIGLMLAVLLVFLGVLVTQLLGKTNQKLYDSIAKKERQLEKIQRLRQEWEQLLVIPETPVSSASLTSLIERGARTFEVQDRLQLNALPTGTSKGLEGLQVRLDRLNLDELFSILYYLENQKPVIVLENLEVAQAIGSDLLKATFRAYKREK